METRKHKLNKALLLLALSAVAILVLFLFGTGSSAYAVGGSDIDYNTTEVVTIAMDANGVTNAVEDQIGDFNQANENTTKYRSRTISCNILLSKLLNTDVTETYWVEKNGDVIDGYINNTPSDVFEVSFNWTPDQSETIKITAKKPTEKQRFVLKLYTGSESSKTYKMVTVEVQIKAGTQTWFQSGTTSPKELFVGPQLNDDRKTERTDTTSLTYKPLPVRLANYDTVNIDLADYLKGRKLYTKSGKTILNDGVVIPQGARNGFDSDTEKAYGVLKDEESNKPDPSNQEYTVFNDLSGLEITENPSCSVVKSTHTKLYGPTPTQKFTVSVQFTKDQITSEDNLGVNGKFWEETDPNAQTYHDFPVNVKLNGVSFTIYIPVVFDPADKPKVKDSFTMPIALNAGSEKSYLEAADNARDPSGFKAVRVRPQDLCDYPTYTVEGESSIYFGEGDDNAPNGGEENPYVQITAGGTTNADRYFDITAIENGPNGPVDITFYVRYKRGSTPSSIPVTVNFSVYGQYRLNFSIDGKKKKTFSINDKLFNTLKSDGYQIVDAGTLDDESGKTYAIVSCENGVISITPKETVSKDELVYVRLVNIKGQEITLRCGLQLDLKAGNFFATWETWQVILFWVGIGLAALLLILLIIWLFVRSVHRKKMDELETSAPTSAYIIKLNSTIAAAQAQQRLATTQAFNTAQTQMLQLGAGPASTPAANPNTLQLGTAPMTSQGAMSYSAPPPPPQPMQQQPVTEPVTPPPAQEEIIILLTDEELLARIYEEKYKPRGMLERTFYKSKDLQQRELEKEKERIREDVRNGMSMEEACKSLKQREAEAAANIADTATVSMGTGVDPIILLLGFDPVDPIVSQEKPAEVSPDATPEEVKLAEAEYDYRRLKAEMSIIDSRIEAINAATAKTEESKNAASTEIEALTDGIKTAEQTLDDKSADLVVAKGKAAREALNKEINDLEGKLKADKDTLQVRKGDLESETSILARLAEITADYAGKKTAADALLSTAEQEYHDAQAEADRAAELAARAKAQALLNSQLEVLNPMLVEVNTLDNEIRDLTNFIEHSGESKDSLKTKVATKQNELLSTTDAAMIGELSEEIKSLNKEISDLDHAVVASTKQKTDKNIAMASVRRKANEYVDKENMGIDDIIAAEDVVIGNIALDRLRAETEKEKLACEENVHKWQLEHDTLVSNLDATVMESAAKFAETVKASEDELAETQAKLVEVNLAIETCENDDEKMNYTLDQMTLQEKVNELTAAVESMRAEGIKANLETKMKGEEEIENARVELDKAKEAFDQATTRYDDISTKTNPLDLIVSGSGVISQDRKKIEEENLKKQLAESKNAVEQAKLQAQMAQMEAEKAIVEAQRASDATKAEAERIAQEALEQAEKARLEAEAKAAEETERVRQESEEYKRAAQEEADKARQELEEARKAAEEEAERVRQELEESKRMAEEEAERLRIEAEEARKAAEEEAERVRIEAEEARKAAEEEAERARKEAEEAAERARIEAEEAAEKARKEAEEAAEKARKEAEEEAEKARKAAEEEAQAAAAEEEKRKARVAEKVAKRKAEIAKLRAELKEITEEEQGTALREKFYAMQLALDDDEKTSAELNDLLTKSMDDASHAAELSRYKKLANQKPRRIVKKVTERVNYRPKKKTGARPAGARPAGARPASRPGARPAGARPASRPGARPAGARPAGARPTGARQTRRVTRRPGPSGK